MVDGWWTSCGCWCRGQSRTSCNQSEKGRRIDRRVWLRCYISKTSLLFPTHLQLLKTTWSALLFTAGRPQTAVGPVTPRHQRLSDSKARHIALCYSIPSLYRSFLAVFLARDELIRMCTQTERRGSELITKSDRYNSEKKKERKKTESYIFIFRNESIKFLSVG